MSAKKAEEALLKEERKKAAEQQEEKQQQEESQQVAEPEEIDENPKVMVVDDSRTIQLQLRNLLLKEGYDVVVHSDGQSALDYLNQLKDNGELRQFKKFGIISDIEMPRMDGHHFCMRVREDDDFNKIPVILFSSILS